MKNFAVLILLGSFLLCSLKGNSQGASGNLYEDAKVFQKDLYEHKLTDRLLNVVTWYFGTEATQANVKGMLTGQTLFIPLSTQINALTPAPPPAASPAGLSSNFIGMNVAKYADGAAKFLIERGKLEVSMTFFSRLNDEMNKYPELRLLLPRTFEVIGKIEAFNYQNLLQELKDALTKDLLDMPTSILSIRDVNLSVCGSDTECQARLQAMINLLNTGDPRAVVLPLVAIQEIINGSNIIEIVNALVVDRTVCSLPVAAVNDDFNGYLKFTAIMLQMFQGSASDGGIFISHSQMKDLFATPDLFRIFVALGYQKYNSQHCFQTLSIGGQNLLSIFTALIKQQEMFAAALGNFDDMNVSSAGVVRSIKTSQKVDSDQYATLVSSSLGLISKFQKAVNKITGGTFMAQQTTLFSNIGIVSEIAVDITKKNFAGVFNGLSQFMITNRIVADQNVRNRFVTYLAFGANMASATTSDEVKEAIEAIALPPGSFSVKQKTAWSISLNGFVGYAWDFSSGPYMRGVYAPIGFTFSKGLSKRYGGAVSIFTSVIDVGGIAAYRLEDESTDELKQEVRLESIFSPSAQLQITIPQTPLAITAGWRSTPKLFYSGGDTEPFKTVSSTSVFNLSLLIDVPIATLFSGAYR